MTGFRGDEDAAEGPDGTSNANHGSRLALEFHGRCLGVDPGCGGMLPAKPREHRGDHLVNRSVAQSAQQEDHHVGSEEEDETPVLDAVDRPEDEHRHARENGHRHPGTSDPVGQPATDWPCQRADKGPDEAQPCQVGGDEGVSAEELREGVLHDQRQGKGEPDE